VSDASAVGETARLRVRKLRDAQRRCQRLFILLLGVALLGTSIAALTVGPVPISVSDTLKALLPFGNSSAAEEQAGEIIRSIRVPRLVLGIAAGAALGISGAALQGLFRNPLADPGIIGISSGAALAVGLFIVIGHGIVPEAYAWAGPYAMPVAAFAGALIALAGVCALSLRAGAMSGASLILAGIAVNAVSGSALGYLSFASTDDQLRQLTFWSLGSLGGATWTTLIPAVIAMAAAVIMLLRFAQPLNSFMLGEREAAHLGVDVERLKRSLILLASLGAGASVAVAGIIGFVGLAAPHLVRLCVGSNNRVVLPGAALLGATLLLVADSIARTAVSPAELPIGVLTGALGGPFFLWLLSRHRRELY
jgi:iron complex transport system permease protein